MAFYGAYSYKQYWNRQYQIARSSATPDQASNWRRVPDHDIQRRNREYRASLKQEEIIELKLESQALLIQERELAKLQDKQSQRHLRALRKQNEELRLMIARELLLLGAMQAQQEMQRRQKMMLLIMQMSYPYLNIMTGGTEMH